jgi:hypothetical protein
MATTTPNFGWVVPTSTDLVKNGATAIETLGDSIDASMAELKGGTTGQVLSKTSNTDMDFTWVAQDDSNAIQNSIVDAKGDLIAATANDTPARLAIGTDGQVLMADSTAATGIKWAAAPASTPTFAGALIYSASYLTAATATWTALAFDSEVYDTNAYHSTSATTTRITIPTGKAGYYKFYGAAVCTGVAAATKNFIGGLYKNGVLVRQIATASNADDNSFIIDSVESTAVADYFEFYVYQDGGATEDIKPGATKTYFGCALIGA